MHLIKAVKNLLPEGSLKLRLSIPFISHGPVSFLPIWFYYLILTINKLVLIFVFGNNSTTHIVS